MSSIHSLLTNPSFLALQKLARASAPAQIEPAVADKGAVAQTKQKHSAAPVDETGFDDAHGADKKAEQCVTININFNFGGVGGAGEAGAIPKPSTELSGSPAGEGLSKGAEGFSSNSVRTAGGYTIVPEGKDAAWSIYAPGQKSGETPISRIWGDPHVSEGDGTKWDFTKGSNFMLPDGTKISARTTAETGQSVTAGLDIVNGADRVTVDGINTNEPKVSEIKADGEGFWNKHSKQNKDAFLLEHDDGNKQVNWFRERNGKMDGLITGARLQDGSYEQDVDGTKKMGELEDATAAEETKPAGEVKDVGDAGEIGTVEAKDESPGVQAADDAAGGGEKSELGQFFELLQNLFAMLQKMLGVFGGDLGGLGQLGQTVQEEDGLEQATGAARKKVIAA